MTEYIIIVALIAVGAIGVYNLFGKTVRQQTSGMAQGLAGKDVEAKAATDAAVGTAGAATTAANQVKGLSEFAKDSGNK